MSSRSHLGTGPIGALFSVIKPTEQRVKPRYLWKKADVVELINATRSKSKQVRRKAIAIIRRLLCLRYAEFTGYLAFDYESDPAD